MALSCAVSVLSSIAVTGMASLTTWTPFSVRGVGSAEHFCPTGAISLLPTVNGQWFVSQARCGPMVHGG